MFRRRKNIGGQLIQIRGGKSALYWEQKRQMRGGKCVKLGGANVPRANELLPPLIQKCNYQNQKEERVSINFIIIFLAQTVGLLFQKGDFV